MHMKYGKVVTLDETIESSEVVKALKAAVERRDVPSQAAPRTRAAQCG